MRWHYFFLLLAACNEEEQQDCGCAGTHAEWHDTGRSGQDVDIDIHNVSYAPATDAAVEWTYAGIELYRGLDYLAFIELPDFYEIPAGHTPLATLNLDAFYCDDGSLVREGPDFYCRVAEELLPPEGERLDGTLDSKDGENYELTVTRAGSKRVHLYMKRVVERSQPTGEYVYECGVH